MCLLNMLSNNLQLDVNVIYLLWCTVSISSSYIFVDVKNLPFEFMDGCEMLMHIVVMFSDLAI